MKIPARLDYESSSSDIPIRAICALPEELRPTRHSEGEHGAGKPIGDVEEYLALDNRGSILRGRGVYDRGRACDNRSWVDVG